jgi:hypothetical protein
MVGNVVLFSEASEFGSDGLAKNNSYQHLLYLFKNFLCRWTEKMYTHLRCSNDNRSAAIFFNCSASRSGGSSIHVTSFLENITTRRTVHYG